jgi:two-component system NarL family sensor kinase
VKSIHFKSKVILLSVLPILVMSGVLTALSIINIQKLGEKNIQGFTDRVNTLRREELKNYTQIAVKAVEHIYQHAADNDVEAQHMVTDIFRDLHYGDDGYFFVYDYRGNSIVNPQKRHLEGQNLWYLRDSNGVYIIRSLVREAKNDLGGYTEYIWEKPSLGREVDKISFSMGLSDWNWMVGTGIYLDDITQVTAEIKEDIDDNTKNVALITLAVSLFFTCCVAVFAIRFTMSQGRFANYKLQKLSRSCVRERELDRVKMADSLHAGVSTGIISSIKKYKSLLKTCGSMEDMQERSFVVLSELNKLLTSVEKIANDLHPKVLVDEGLGVAVEELSETFSNDSGIKIHVKSIVNSLERLPLDVETVSYRIVQEALNNALLHSSATEVSVRIRQSRNVLNVTIQDDGMGFDLDSVSEHRHRGSGLLVMELHAELLSGSLTVFSAKGTGTTIKVSVPLNI